MSDVAELGHRYCDQSHTWALDEDIFSSKSPKDYAKFIEKTKKKGHESRCVQWLDFLPPTPSQKKVLVRVSKFLDLSEREAKLSPLRMLIAGGAGTG